MLYNILYIYIYSKTLAGVFVQECSEFSITVLKPNPREKTTKTKFYEDVIHIYSLDLTSTFFTTLLQ